MLEVLVAGASGSWFVPDLVTNRTCVAPCAELSAPAVAVVSVTSSTASRRGVTIVKKPSPDCRLLLVLTPSIVMLIVFCGSPLIVEPRAFAPPVSTPGRKTRKSSALRLRAARS